MKRKINPQVYLDAASLIEERRFEFACSACSACGGHYYESLFAEYFKPENMYSGYPWFGILGNEAERNDRILALLFMHQIAKDL